MAHFSFIARRPDGSVQRGSVDAPTAEAAREKLRKQGLIVEEMQERPPSPPRQQSPSPVPIAAAAAPRPAPPPPRPAPPPVAPPTAVAAPVADFVPLVKPKDNGEESGYVPLGDTLRLFAGWLLAWYGVVYLVGDYQRSGKLPFELPFVESMFTSPLILRFAFGTFLFLFFSTLHRWMGGGILKGCTLFLLWVITVAFFHVNV